MFQKIIQIFKIKELRNKVLFVLAILAVFRIAAAIPIPGVDITRLKSFFQDNQLFGLLNIFSGGALENLSIVMLGVGPFITASIIMQLLTMIFPRLKEAYHESGEQGREKFNQWTRYLTVPLGGIQAFGLITLLQNQQILSRLSLGQLITDIIIVTAGTVFLMWLGELVSEKGIGNGISLLIFAGIVVAIPSTVRNTVLTYTPQALPGIISFLAITVLVIAGVVFINEAQRNIPVSYAKRIRGHRLFGGVSTYLPLRVNQAGVIPIIFALSIMLFPGLISNFLASSSIGFIANISRSMGNLFENQWFYSSLYFVLVVLFTYFYTAVTFDPNVISENIQKQGGFVPGIRPGRNTSEFLYKILNRITLVGAIFLGLIAILPFIVRGVTGVSAITIGGTAVLIVVAVILETMKQVQSQLAMREYD